MKRFFDAINLTPRQLLYAILLMLLVVLVIQNVEAVLFRFLFFEFEMPLIIAIVGAFFIGFFTARVFPSSRARGDRKGSADGDTPKRSNPE